MVRRSTIVKIILGLIVFFGVIVTLTPVAADETSAGVSAGSAQSEAMQVAETDQASPEGMEWGYTYDLVARPIRHQAYTNEALSESDLYVAPHTNAVPVTGPAPVAAFTGTPVSGAPPLTVTFKDTSTGSPTGWAWFFGDESYTQKWTPQTVSPGWNVRSAHTSVVIPDGSIVLMGGLEDGYHPSLRNDVWLSADAGKTWTLQTSKAQWAPRFMHASVVMPDRSIVLMGGVDYVANYNDTWRSTDYGKHWELRNGKAPWSARSRPTTVVMPDSSIILMGGYSGQDTYLNDVWRSTDYGSTWTLQTKTAEWSGRGYASSVVMPDRSIVLMGGRRHDTDLNDVWLSTDAGKTWTLQNSRAPWSARSAFSSVVMPDGSIVITGGFGDNNAINNEVWRSTDAGKTWTRLPSSSAEWYARGFHTSHAMPDGSIVVIGGRTLAKNAWADLNDVWRVSFAGSGQQNPQHIYASNGTYSVALQAYNANGSNTAARKNFISVYKPPVIEWQKPFGGSRTDFGEFVVRTADNGIIIGGATSSSDGDILEKEFHGITDIVLAKYDTTNSLEWSRIYGGYDGVSTVRQIQTLPDGYLVAGESYATNGDLSGHHGSNQTSDIWLLRLDSAGNKVWNKSYGGSSSDVAMWIENTPDNGFVISGFTYSTDGDFAGLRTKNTSCDAFVMKIDRDGAIRWKNVYGGTNDDEAAQIELSPDKTRYYVIGTTWSNDGDVAHKNHGGDNGTADGWVFSIDLNGNLLWSKCYGGSDEELFWGIDTADATGDIVVTGSTKSRVGDQQIPASKHGPAGSSDIWYLRLDSTGNILSNKCFGGIRNDDGQSIRVTGDGDVFILGSTQSSDGDVTDKHGGSDATSDLWLIKSDKDGNILWQKCYGGSGDDWGMRFDVQQKGELINNGYVIGTTTSNDGDVSKNHGLGDIWMLRLVAAKGDSL